MVDGRVSDLLAAAKEQLNRYSRGNPVLETLPHWVTSFRTWQRDAIDDIMDGFHNADLVILDGPPGTGKTLIAEAVRRMVGILSCLYVCNSKSLQAQFIRDYKYAALLQGRSNYPTQKHPGRFKDPSPFRQLSCADCTKASPSGCNWCEGVNRCPYEIAKHIGLRSPLTVLNTAYFLTEVNGPGRFRGRELVILDECDTLEWELMSYVSVEISPARLNTVGLGPPDKVTVPSSWITWLDTAIPTFENYRLSLPEDNLSPRDIREIKTTDGILSQLKRIQRDLLGESNGWVYSGRDNRVSFKPTKINEMAGSLLWAHGKKWLLMSGSVISPEELIASLGWEKDYNVVSVPSPFLASNRPIYIRPVANMARSAEGDQSEKLISGIRNIILDTAPSDRVLLHTVSYDLTNKVQEKLRVDRPIFGYLNSGDREDALSKFMATIGAILVAPSFDRGIDLPDEACRIQLICKVPYPNLGDRQIGARLHSVDGQLWYNVQTARTLIQMTGRAVRHSEDWAKTYILDEQFIGFFKKNNRLFPEWWKQALVWRYL